uniref:NB-ARC domain-containing protein n=1 Tax=Kalanchoe fedtschenkoi TaxID=63787 RepID=A0A7N0U2Q3_KALFE
MSGLEQAVVETACKILCSKGAHDFFFKWQLDESLLDRLKDKVKTTKDLLKVAGMRQIQENSIGDEWFTKARFAICDAEDVLDKIFTDVQKEEYRMGDSPGTCLIVKEKLRYKGKDIGRSVHPFKKTREAEMSEIIRKLESVASELSRFGLDTNAELEAIREMRGEPTSSVNDTIKVCGRAEDKKKIMKLLGSTGGVDDALRVIPIVGLGGVGKTTLANMIFHECKSLSQTFLLPSLIPRQPHMDEDGTLKAPVFDVKVWVCLSDEFQVVDVIKSILEFITREKPALDGLDSLQRKLKELLQGKKFLIILDDNWSKDRKKWDDLRTPFLVGQSGSRIIVTTRLKEVAEIVTSVQGFFYQLEHMSENESWSLFESVAFSYGSEGASPTLKEIGRRIVDKCKGLPLAIKMIGGLLFSYGNDEMKWKSVLESTVWSSTSEIRASLWLSYYHLPQPVQQCFAYFSLFPKDYEFQMDEMVMLWVAEGFIERTPEIEQLEDVAREYFNHLLLNFFIQESSSVNSQFVLHDLVHDLAEYVSNGICVDWKDINLQSRRLSYVGGDEPLRSKSKVQKLTRLRTFLPMVNPFHHSYLEKQILSDMLSNFKLLRVLSLEGYSISVLPDSVGDMKLLRYMNISSTNIECLPLRIYRLYNLQFLILRDCEKLKRLPANIGGLVKLRYLDVHGTPLEEMPYGIGSMKKLQVLSNHVVGKDKSEQMKELKDLTSLHGKLQISGLNNITDKEHVVAAQFGKKEYLEKLVLNWKQIEGRDTSLDESVLDAIQAHENLKELTVGGYGGKRLSTWIVGMTHSSSIMLRSLCIYDCSNLETLPPLGNLPSLMKLTIIRSKCMKSLGEEFCGGSSNPFPALEILDIKCMEVLETWSFSGSDGMGFASLKELRISRCPMLTNMPSLGILRLLKKLIIEELKCLGFLDEGFYGNDCCDVFFPSLETFEIRGMDALKTWSLPGRNRQGFPSLKKLIIHNCPELMTFPICFPSLTDLEIDRCYKLSGPEMCGGASLGSLPALKNLTMRGVDRIKSFNEEFYGDDCSNASFFPALETFAICGMSGLKTWCFPGRWGFASLKDLEIIDCCELIKIPFCFPCLTNLRIWNCDNLIEIEMFGGEEEGSVSTTYGHSLIYIWVIHCPKLEEIPKSFVNLVDVNCRDGYNKLASLPRLQHVRKLSLDDVSESLSLKAAIHDSTYLEELIIPTHCRNVVVELLGLDPNCLTSLKSLHLVFTEDDDRERICWENNDKVAKRAPPNLSHLRITGWSVQMSAKILTHFSNLSGALITDLEFFKCHALEAFPPDVELPSTLQSLQIWKCDALKTISDRFLNGCSNSLQELTIEYCRSLVCLPQSLSVLQSIKKLQISCCGALESLPDGFHNATTLRILSLQNCPKLVVPKECGFPTTLTHLNIWNCDEMKAVSNLRLKKLTSLTHMELGGFPETFTLEAGCLPVSIEELTIENFPHLKSLSGVLPTLKNLRRLDVRECPLVN